MRPTVFLGLAVEDGATWTGRDRELAKALVMYESTLCGGCGHSTIETGDPDREGWYDADVAVCAGCMAIEKARRDKKSTLGDGERHVAVLHPGFHTRTHP